MLTETSLKKNIFLQRVPIANVIWITSESNLEKLKKNADSLTQWNKSTALMTFEINLTLIKIGDNQGANDIEVKKGASGSVRVSKLD